jgi:anthranilate phosphoribosyltransferase
MVRVLRDLGHERALVFYGQDGLDELSTTANSRVFQLEKGDVKDYELHPQQLGLPKAAPADLLGGTPAENAALIRQILEGKKGPQRDVVVLNAAAAVIAGGRAEDWRQARQVAEESIDGGGAGRVLERFISRSQELKGKA